MFRLEMHEKDKNENGVMHTYRHTCRKNSSMSVNSGLEAFALGVCVNKMSAMFN